MALSNEIQSLKDQLERSRTLLRKLESGKMLSANPEYDTQEWIKNLKTDVAKAEAALRELEGLK